MNAQADAIIGLKGEKLKNKKRPRKQLMQLVQVVYD